MPSELTVRIAAYAQFQHQDCQKDDLIEDEGKFCLFPGHEHCLHRTVAVLWQALTGLQGPELAVAINRIGDLEHMVDRETGHPIVNVVKYIGPKAGHNIMATKPCPFSQVCRRLRRESADFVRGAYFHINLYTGKYDPTTGPAETRVAISQALIAVAKEVERLPMLRHLMVAFYNVDRGHRRLQANYLSAFGTLHGVDSQEVSAWYSKTLQSMTSVEWADRELRSGGYMTPDSWLTFVYELRDADNTAALADIRNWREQGVEIFEND